MKKIYLIAALLLMGTGTHAQYFQHVYGTSQNERLNSGINTDPAVQGLGHFMAGQSRLGCLAPVSTIPVAFTDVDGNIPGAPYFENNFMLIRPNGVVVHAKDPQVFELNNGNGFGVIGMYIDFSLPSPGNTAVFYLQLDPKGNPVAAYDYPIASSGSIIYDVVSVGGIAESVYTSGGKEVYVTGTAQTSTADLDLFALKLDVNSGTVLWGWTYNLNGPVTPSQDWGKGVTESPYGPFGAKEIVVVGNTSDNVTGFNDGYILHIDATNGTPIAFPALLYGKDGRQDNFNSVRVAQNTSYAKGFIIGGSTDVSGTVDFYVVSTDAVGFPNWVSSFDYSVNPNVYNECFDAIERINTFGKSEYYAVGQTDKGFFGAFDALVIKMDANGAGVPGGEFTYGSPNADMGRMLDQYNDPGSSYEGLSTFGNWNGGTLGASDMYLVKSYFNGVSGCNELLKTPLATFPPTQHNKKPFKEIEKFNTGTLIAGYTPLNDVTLCYSPSISGGNNARVAPKDDGTDKAMIVMPNPAETGIKTVTVEVESPEPTKAEVAIYDMMGRLYYNGTFTLTKGTNKLPLDIGTLNMAPGMYNVTISGGTTPENKLLLIK